MATTCGWRSHRSTPSSRPRRQPSLILERLEDAKSAGADLVLFPELAVTGYRPKTCCCDAGFVRAAERSLEESRARARHRGRRRIAALERDLYNVPRCAPAAR